MEAISVFDMLKIGIGPSSSHTLGPWRACQRFVHELIASGNFDRTQQLEVHLYGSLALTGYGHGTDIAVLLGLSGMDPVTIPIEDVQEIPRRIRTDNRLHLNQQHWISFNPRLDILFRFSEVLPYHANGMMIVAFDQDRNETYRATYYSIGGGFVVKEEETQNGAQPSIRLPFSINAGRELMTYCREQSCCIWKIVYENEKSWRSEEAIRKDLLHIWEVMRDSIFRGCFTEGELPGGLQVKRRAAAINRRLLGEETYDSAKTWMQAIKKRQFDFSQTIKWIGCFAMAVNEENANFGRIVTAPTNGASGVIPAVLFYYILFSGQEVEEQEILQFLLVAGEIGSLFKKGSTISAAMGGCQAEIGVSSAMAAAALCEGCGGTPEQALMAAEIAMEHHLGLTCDPIGGLVQVPCIERNSMGAMKAITAAKIALESDPQYAKVSLDTVIKTMLETAMDMNTKYKETSQGGLAANIAISVPEC